MVENFDSRAASWDDDPARLSRARQVAETIKANLPLTGRPITVELGAGTGLLSRCLADVLGPTTLLDSSPAMVEAASKALAAAGLKDWNAAVADLSEGIPGGPYELVLAQMFLHHVDDVPALLGSLRRFVVPGGVVAIADLDHDADGLYHSTSVDFHGHHGFPPPMTSASHRWSGAWGAAGLAGRAADPGVPGLAAPAGPSRSPWSPGASKVPRLSGLP